MLKESSIVQDWLTESQKQGRLSVLQIILSQKLGALSPELLSKIYQLNGEELDRLSTALLNINSQQELQAWLSNGAMQEAH